MGDGTFDELIGVDFNRMRLQEIEQWQKDAEGYKLLLESKMTKASQTARELRIIAAGSPHLHRAPPPLPTNGTWVIHPQSTKYEYNTETREVRLRVPPLPAPSLADVPSPAHPDFNPDTYESPEKKKPGRNKSVVIDGVTIPEYLRDVYQFIMNSKTVCFVSQMVTAFPDKNAATIERHAHLLAHMKKIKKVGPTMFEPPWESDKPFVFDSEECALLRLVRIAQNYKRPFTKEMIGKKFGSEDHAGVMLSTAKRMGFIDKIDHNSYTADKNPPKYIISKEKLQRPAEKIVEVLRRFGKPMHYIDISREIKTGYDATRHHLQRATDSKLIKSVGPEKSGVYAHLNYQMSLPIGNPAT